MDIRKISVGADYKSGAMHYIKGQEVLGGSHTIHLIQAQERSFRIWIIKDEKVYVWKEFLSTLPISLEYNINF
tara:strand:+ start:3719 stop:3937 length:219 start_codon:yes stop_codon:yes gene_type:complete